MRFSKAIEGYCLALSSDPDYSSITAKSYQDALRRMCEFWDDPELENITEETIYEYLGSIKRRGLKQSTAKYYHRVLWSFYNWSAIKLKVDRPGDIPSPKAPDAEIIPFSNDDVVRLFRAARTIRYKAIMFVLLDTGIRVGELIRLKVRDVDLVSGAVTILPFETGIKSRRREVYLSKNSRNVIWQYNASREIEPTSPLISTEDGYPLERFSINKILIRVGHAAGVRGVNPHRFRHTFAIEYLRNGGDIFTLKRLLGHSSWKVVQLYLEIARADIVNAHRKASPVDNLRLR